MFLKLVWFYKSVSFIICNLVYTVRINAWQKMLLHWRLIEMRTFYFEVLVFQQHIRFKKVTFGFPTFLYFLYSFFFHLVYHLFLFLFKSQLYIIFHCMHGCTSGEAKLFTHLCAMCTVTSYTFSLVQGKCNTLIPNDIISVGDVYMWETCYQCF